MHEQQCFDLKLNAA